MTTRKTERILNLTICLLVADRHLTKDRIRAAVEGYHDLTDAAFDRTFERDKDELRSLGLACPSTAGGWSARPLLDVVDRLRVERFAELDRSVAAAEAIASRLLRPRSDPADGVSTLVGRESIVAAHDELCGSAFGSAAVPPPQIAQCIDVLGVDSQEQKTFKIIPRRTRGGVPGPEPPIWIQVLKARVDRM